MDTLFPNGGIALAKQPQREDTFPTPGRYRRVGRWLGVAIALLALAYVTAAVALDQFGQVERARPAQAIIVLGAMVLRDGQPSDVLQARTLKAVTLYKRGLAHYLIFTGGPVEYGRAQSVVAGELAESAGVPAQAILRETRSTDTRENVRYATQICRRHGWKRVIVVSDPYHLWRVRYLFRREGIIAYTSPSYECHPHSRTFATRSESATREVLAVIKDVLNIGH